MNRDNDVLTYPILIPSSREPSSRPCHLWTFQFLSDILKDKKLSCRVWRKSHEQVLETACDHVHVSLEEFKAWLQSDIEDGNPLAPYDRTSHAAYIDYKYMKDVFSNCPEKLQDVQWKDFGLPEFDGKDSTIWIGSEGANTPGHQDCYGFNLVTQIEGRKMWVLFPPSDTECLYPTRVPFEESSVFSQVHIGFPDIEKYPALKNSHPVVVVLHPGQTLYVPRHWWHYVESLEPSISLNVWVPHESDSSSHLTESLTRCLATSLLPSADDSLYRQLLNPTETLYSQSENLQFLKCAVENVLTKSMRLSTSNLHQPEPDSKLIKPHSKPRQEEEVLASPNNIECCDNYLLKFSHWLKTSCNSIDAKTNPCHGFGDSHCADDFEGCVACGVTLKKNIYEHGGEPNSAYPETKKTKSCDGSLHGNTTSKLGVECESVSSKRVFEQELDDFSKRHKDNGGRISSPSHHNQSVCDKSLCHRSILLKSDSNNSSKVLENDAIAMTKTVYSLTKPFSFDHYLRIMKVKEERCGVFENVDFARRPYTYTIVNPGEKGTDCSPGNENLESSTCDMTAVELKHSVHALCHSHCLSPSSSYPHITPTLCPNSLSSSTSKGLPTTTTTCIHSFHSSHFSLPEISAKGQSSDTIDGNNLCEEETIVSNDVATPDIMKSTFTSSVSVTDVQRLFFESVLDPGVVDQIASVFRQKCEAFIAKRGKRN